jgi:Spy/CpxP family protein refolding chaperone
MENKMNKTTLLVLTCALFVAFAGLQSFAQSSADPASSQAASTSQAGPAADPETQAKVQAKLQELSAELNLTDDQKAQLKPIVQDEIQKLRAVNDDASLTADQKKAKFTEIRQSYKSQMVSILNPEQQKKLELLKETSPK